MKISDLLNPEKSFFRFVIATSCLTITIQVIYDLTKDRFGFVGAITLVVILVLIAAWILWQERRRDFYSRKLKPSQRAIEPHKGVILLVSANPQFVDLAKTSISPHAQAIRHCWLVFSEGSRANALSAQAEIKRLWPQVYVHLSDDYKVDPEEIASTWQVVDAIYNSELPELSLKPEEIVADITGGQKPMTAGMALACNRQGWNMQYVVTPRDEKGQERKGAVKYPVLISTFLSDANVE